MGGTLMSLFAAFLRPGYRLYGAPEDFKACCARSNVPCTVLARSGMVHCYCMLPVFREAREDFARIVAYIGE